MPLIFIPAQLRDLTGGAAQVEAEGGTVLEVIESLERLHPGLKDRLCSGEKLAPGLQVSIDHVMSPRGLRAKLSPTSELHFLPVIGGG